MRPHERQVQVGAVRRVLQRLFVRVDRVSDPAQHQVHVCLRGLHGGLVVVAPHVARDLGKGLEGLEEEGGE